MSELARFWAADTWLHTWLAGRARGRWATARGRWIQAVLTAALLVAGLGAWALAIIQPWTAKTADPGVFAVSSGVTPEKVRSAAVGVDELVGDRKATVPAPLQRNPFDHARSGTVEAVAPGAKRLAPHTVGAADVPADRPTPQDILEKVKGLRLEVILITPEGQRWVVINGEDYREGEAVSGFRIVEIHEGRAKLQQGGVTCLLRMD